MKDNQAGSATGFDLAVLEQLARFEPGMDYELQCVTMVPAAEGKYVKLDEFLSLARATPQHSVTEQASIDTPEFDDLLCKFAHESSCEQYDEVEYTKARTALLSYINQPLASTAVTQPEQAEGPRAWMIWLHGPAGVFENKDEALLELARRNRLYPKEASDRKLLELSAALAIPASTAKKEQK